MYFEKQFTTNLMVMENKILNISKIQNININCAFKMMKFLIKYELGDVTGYKPVPLN